jgi:GNAT superfamily N-acetyltransferase
MLANAVVAAACVGPHRVDHEKRRAWRLASYWTNRARCRAPASRSVALVWPYLMQSVELRPATPADWAFAQRVYFDTQRWLIETLFGWRGDDIERTKFDGFYDEQNTKIVQIDGEDIGWLTVFCESDRVEVDSIYLEPTSQKAGLGTYLLSQIISEAQAKRKRVTISTAKINPADTSVLNR